MTAITMNYVVNPFARIWRGIQNGLLIAGHSRAAAELARMGYHAESKAVMMELKKLKEAK
jgi:predicted MFS family arabinose efflux permease